MPVYQLPLLSVKQDNHFMHSIEGERKSIKSTHHPSSLRKDQVQEEITEKNPKELGTYPVLSKDMIILKVTVLNCSKSIRLMELKLVHDNSPEMLVKKNELIFNLTLH